MDNLQEVPVSVIEVWMQNFRQGRSYYMSDLEQERGQPSYEMLKAQQVWRLLAVPLMKGGAVVGFLGVDNPRAHYDDATLLASIQFFVTNSLDPKSSRPIWKSSATATCLPACTTATDTSSGWKPTSRCRISRSVPSTST